MNSMNNPRRCDPDNAPEELSPTAQEVVEENRRLTAAIRKAEREISEAIRVGAYNCAEYLLSAHRTLTGTGVVIGYKAKDQP